MKMITKIVIVAVVEKVVTCFKARCELHSSTGGVLCH